jgi:hypothetical protein
VKLTISGSIRNRKSSEVQPDGSWKSLYETVEGTVEVTINEQEIARLVAARALYTKGGKASAMGDLVKARVLTRTSRPEVAA